MKQKEEDMFLEKKYFIILYSSIMYVCVYALAKVPEKGLEVKLPVLLRKILFPMLGRENVQIALSIMAGYLLAGDIIFYGLKLTVCRLCNWTDLNTAWMLLFILFGFIGGLFGFIKEALHEMTKISWGQALVSWVGIIILSIIITGYLIFLFVFFARYFVIIPKGE